MPAATAHRQQISQPNPRYAALTVCLNIKIINGNTCNSTYASVIGPNVDAMPDYDGVATLHAEQLEGDTFLIAVQNACYFLDLQRHPTGMESDDEMISGSMPCRIPLAITRVARFLNCNEEGVTLLLLCMKAGNNS